MAEQRNKRDGWLLVCYMLLLVFGMCLLVMGFVELYRHGNPLLLGLGVLAVLIPAALYPIATALQSPPPDDNPKQAVELLRTINDRLLISDAAKSIAYRAQDRQALRQAIREDINRGDYDAALRLAQDMADEYGYREEAEQVRDEILAARSAEYETKVNQAIAKLDTLLANQDWPTATAESAKIMRMFPESPLVVGLQNRVLDAKNRKKQELERAFREAAEHDDVDRAVELLTPLDKYLTPVEAEPLRELVRGVISKKRQNLGVQFKLAVHDKEWSNALRIGEQIMNEFPTTRMSEEVKGMIDLLRKRAAEEEAAGASARGA